MIFKIIKRVYFLVALRTNKQKVAFLRDAGTKIGDGVIIREVKSLGSEPYLIEIGDNTSFSSGVRIVTHDGSVGRTHYMGLTEKEYKCFFDDTAIMNAYEKRIYITNNIYFIL